MNHTAAMDRYLTNHLGAIAGHGTDHRAEGHLTLRRLERWMPSDRTSAILEIGPGFGGFLQACIDTGRTDLSAVDISSEVAEAVRTTTGIRVAVVSDTKEWLDAHVSCFDAIIGVEVIEHVPHDQVIALLGACRRALRPGGVLILETPNMSAPLSGLHHRYADFSHRLGFTAESLRYVHLEAGFTRVEVAPLPVVGSRRKVVAQHIAATISSACFRALYRPWGSLPATTLAPIIVSVGRS